MHQLTRELDRGEQTTDICAAGTRKIERGAVID
jgi:hypothetical protein